MQEVVDRVAEKNIHLEFSDQAKEFIVRIGSNEEYGARPLRRAVQQYVEDPLAEILLKGNLGTVTTITVHPSDIGDKLVFTKGAQPAEGILT